MKRTVTFAIIILALATLLASCQPQPQSVEHQVRFFDGSSVLRTVNVPDGYLVCYFKPDLDDEFIAFDGWFADPQFSQKWDFATPITQDTDIYGKFHIITVTVTFLDKNGEKVDEKTFKGGTQIGPLPEAPEVTGYTFSGWYADPTDDPAEPTWYFYRDCILTAQYEKIVPKILIHAFDDDFTMDWEYGVPLPTSLFESGAPVGYALDGWYADKDYTTEFIFGQPVTQDTDLYAKSHTIDTCVMTVFNGSNDELGYITVNKGDVLVPDDLSNYNQAGYLYELVGWFFDIDRTQLFESPITMNEDVSVYGKWQGITVQVMLSGLGYTKYMDARFGELLPVPDVDPGPDSEILGWYWDDQFTQPCDFEHDIVNRVDLRIYAHVEYKK